MLYRVPFYSPLLCLSVSPYLLQESSLFPQLFLKVVFTVWGKELLHRMVIRFAWLITFELWTMCEEHHDVLSFDFCYKLVIDVR